MGCVTRDGASGVLGESVSRRMFLVVRMRGATSGVPGAALEAVVAAVALLGAGIGGGGGGREEVEPCPREVPVLSPRGISGVAGDADRPDTSRGSCTGVCSSAAVATAVAGVVEGLL